MAREYINVNDFLNTGREKLNKSIDKAYDADEKSDAAIATSNDAKQKSEEANSKSDYTQTQLDLVTGASTIDPAVEQMKVGSDGQTVYNSPDERVRTENQKVTRQLAHKASLSDARLRSVPIGLNDASEELLAALSGGATFNLESIPRDKSVTEIKTTFIDTSTNLFNKLSLKRKTVLSTSDGSEQADSTFSASDFIPVKDTKAYSWNGTRARFYYDAEYNFLSYATQTVTTFTPHVGASYMRFTLKLEDANTLQINESEVLLPYEPYRRPSLRVATDNTLFEESLAHSQYSFPPEKTTFFKSSTNLFNKNDILWQETVDGATGDLIYSQTNFTSRKISVIPNQYYTLVSTSSRMTFYDKNDVMISTHVSNSTTGVLTRQAPADAAYLRLSASQSRAETMQLNKGGQALPYEQYYPPYIPKKYLGDIGSSDISDKSYYLAPNLPSKTIDPTTTVEAIDGSGVSGYENLAIGVSDVYGWYDNLHNQYPNYISREQIGLDESGQYPIYVYTFEMPKILETPQTSTYKKNPKIILGTGLHGRNQMGDPNNAIYTLYWFMKDVCEQSQESDWFSYLKNNVTFKIIPLQNPWAIQNVTRKNSNGVDINRNFDTSTWRSAEPNAPDYGGTAPFSESESRALRDFINANLDANLVMDFHTVGTLYDHNKWIYFEMPTGVDLFYVASTHIKTMSSKWKTKPYPLDNSQYYGYVYTALAGKYQEWVNEQGIPAAVMEGAPHIPNTDEPRDSQMVMDMTYDSMSNWLALFIKHLQ